MAEVANEVVRGVVFTQISDGALIPNPKPPERIVITRTNAMGLHDKTGRMELSAAELPVTLTVGALKAQLAARLSLPRRTRLHLHFWGKELVDDSKTLMESKLVTNSELTLTVSSRTHGEMAAIRESSPLRRVRISSNKVMPFVITELTSETTAGDLRKSVHAHLHTPVTFIAVENWKPETDSLVYHRGDQLVQDASGGGGRKKDKGGGVRMSNLRDGSTGVVASTDSLVECRVEPAEVRLFYGGLPLMDNALLADSGVVDDDIIFLDIKRPAPFDPEPLPVPVKGEKKNKEKGKSGGKKK